MALVYEHRRLTDDQVFYVGISQNDKYRPHQRTKRNPIWNRIYRKHGRKVNVLFNDVSLNEAHSIEKYLIGYYGKVSNGGSLANITDGGDGTVNYKHTDEAKQVMSDKKKLAYIGDGNPFKGKTHSKETKRRLSIAHLGKKLTQEHKENISKSQLKKVDQFTLDGVFIKTHNSIKSAANELGGNDTNISRVCKGKRGTAYGFRWKHK